MVQSSKSSKSVALRSKFGLEYNIVQNNGKASFSVTLFIIAIYVYILHLHFQENLSVYMYTHGTTGCLHPMRNISFSLITLYTIDFIKRYSMC